MISSEIRLLPTLWERCALAASLAIPSLHGLSSSIVQLVAELSLTFKSVWQAALCQPRCSVVGS